MTDPTHAAAEAATLLPETFGLPARALEGLCKVLSTQPQIRRALVFGSRARGSHRPASDIDIALEAPALDWTDLVRLANAIDDLLLPQEVDLVLLHQIDNPDLLARIHADGRPLNFNDSHSP